MTTEEQAVFDTFRAGREWMGPSLLSAELSKVGTTGETVFFEAPVNVPIPVVKAMFPISEAATGHHLIGPIMMMAPYAKFYLVAPSATLTAALYASPAYYEGQ